MKHLASILRKSAQVVSLFALCGVTACGDEDKIPAETNTSGTNIQPSGTASNPVNPGSQGTPSNPVNPTTSAGATSGGATGTTTTTTPDNNDTSGTPEGGSGDSLRNLVQTACGWGQRCCDAQEFNYIYNTDPAACTDTILSAVKFGPRASSVGQLGMSGGLLVQLVNQVNLSRSELSEQGAQACIAHLKARACLSPADDQSSCDPKAHENPCALDKLFTGKVPQGGVCSIQSSQGLTHDIECEAGSVCKLDPQQSNLPRCVSVRQEGQPCTPDPANLQSNCSAGLFCSLKAGKCLQPAKAGEQCAFRDDKEPFNGTETIPCADGLSCSAQTKTCVAPCAAQTRCGVVATGTEVAMADADQRICADGLSCVPTLLATKGEGREQDAYIYSCEPARAAGGLCDTHADCGAQGWCKKEGEQKVGACVASIATDAAGCEGDDRRCLAGHYCDGNRCAVKIKAGSDIRCSAHAQCDDASLGCVGTDAQSRRCIAAPLAKDAACDADYGAVELPASQFNRLAPKSGEAVVGASDFRFWANYCESRVCEQGKCNEGAKAGEACDYLINDATKPSCAFGLQCVSGVCQPLLAAGQACEPRTAAEVPACHFDLNGGPGNESACIEVAGEFRCALRARDEQGSYCDGK